MGRPSLYLDNVVKKPLQGFGLGLRTDHYEALLSGSAPVDWLEVISENFMVDGGRPLHMLDQFAERWPMVLHGVSMNLGGSDPLDNDYLKRLSALAKRVNPRRISDHLCWTKKDGVHLHDLLPLVQNEDNVRHVAARVRQVQDVLGEQILIENLSSYLRFSDDTLHEADFIAAIVAESGCGILLDVNNVYVNAHNHGFDAVDYLRRLPAHALGQIHLAGHTYDSLGSGLIIDTHDMPVPDGVWALYAQAVKMFGLVPTMIERDDNIPPLPELLAELNHARAIAAQAMPMEHVA